MERRKEGLAENSKPPKTPFSGTGGGGGGGGGSYLSYRAKRGWKGGRKGWLKTVNPLKLRFPGRGGG